MSVTVPFVTRVVRDYTSGNIMKNEAALARDLRIVIEKLGPTFIKVGGVFSPWRSRSRSKSAAAG